MRHLLFQAFAALTWFALYIALVVLLGQIMAWLSAKYAAAPEDQALVELRKRFEERRRESRCRRLEAVYDEAQVIIEEEKASRIVAKLDYMEQDFALDVDAAQAYLEYRASADGRRSA